MLLTISSSRKMSRSSLRFLTASVRNVEEVWVHATMHSSAKVSVEKTGRALGMAALRPKVDATCPRRPRHDAARRLHMSKSPY
jgi:hypothetical protein